MDQTKASRWWTNISQLGLADIHKYIAVTPRRHSHVRYVLIFRGAVALYRLAVISDFYNDMFYTLHYNLVFKAEMR